MQFIDKLESKFGRFAISGLIQIIAVLQLCVVGMLAILPPESAMEYVELLEFGRGLILSGQVWRLVTHALVLAWLLGMKTAIGKLLWGFVAANLLMFFARGLEQEWGAFRINLYVLAWFFVGWIFGFIFGVGIDGMYLASSVLFGFAVLFPDVELLLFFVLPVKVKWIAWITAGGMLLQILGSPIEIIRILPAHLNFLVAFGPGFIKNFANSAKASERRARFAAAGAAAEFFHQCSVCKKTEVDDPQLDFRVLDSGDEICHVCRAKRAS